MSSEHHRFMTVALALSRRNLGQAWPNPAVGAVVVKDGRMVGQGWTARSGRPHAETEALAQAGESARGAELYVTLEPCAHRGKTPPCADAIIKAGIARCIIACRDPNPKASGGIAQLQEAGIEVVENVCREEAQDINRGFFSVVEKKRPFIALKIATSLDGKIAFPPSLTLPRNGGRGNIKWITGEQARAYGQLLRSRFDAIATGIGTVLADDPLLTCRLPGLEDRSPVRIVFDRAGRLPKNSQLMKTAKEVPVWKTALPPKEAALWLAEKGITRLMIEAGQKLSTAFVESGLVDRIYWFRAPITIGKGGLAAFNEALPNGFKPVNSVTLGTDRLEIYECSAAS